MGVEKEIARSLSQITTKVFTSQAFGPAQDI
jgi:hypothetical protein